MPKIPTRPGPQVSTIADPTPFQTPNIPSGAFGGQIGQAVGGLGDALQIVAKKQLKDREENSRRKAKEIEIQYRARVRELEFGTGQDDGYFSTQGGAAVDGFAQFQVNSEKVRREIIDGIEDSEVRAFFSNSSGVLLQSSLEQGQRHQLSNRRVAESQASGARVAAASQDAASKFNDPAFVRDQELLVRNEVLLQADRLGLDPKVADNLKDEAVSSFWAGIISRAMTTDIPVAKELFEANKDLLLPATFTKIKENLDDQIELQEINALATDIMNQGLDQSAARALAFEIEDESVQKGVLRRISNDFIAQERDRIEAERVTTDDAFANVQGGLSVSALRGADPAGWDAINAIPGLPEKLRQAETQRIKGVEFAPGVHPDKMDAISKLSPNELLRLTPAILKGELNEQETQAVNRLIAGAKETMAKDAQSQAVFNSSLKALKDTAPDGFDFNVEDSSDEERARTNQVINELQAWRQEFNAVEGKPPTPQEVRNQAAALWQELDPGFFSFDIEGTELRRTMPPEQKPFHTPELDTLDEEFVAGVRADLERKGFTNPSPLLLRNILGAMQMNDHARVNRILGQERLNLEAPTPTPSVPRRPLPSKAPKEEVTPGAQSENILNKLGVVSSAQAATPGTSPTAVTIALPSPTADTIPLPPVEPAGELTGDEEDVPDLTPQEGTSGVPAATREKFSEQIKRHEGVRTTVYSDSLGIKTIGVGFNLEASGAADKLASVGVELDDVLAGQELTGEQIDVLFQQDLIEAESNARDIFVNFDDLSPERQTAFTDMSFNLGKTRLKGFKKMIAAANAGDFEKAAFEAQFNKPGVPTKWFTQVGRRGPVIVKQIRGK